MTIINADERERRNIDRTRSMLSAGYTVDEIAEALDASVVTILAFKHAIDCEIATA